MSAIRAGVSILIYNLVSLSERGKGFLRNVILSLFILNLAFPASFFEIGTQFSYIALTSLCFINEPLVLNKKRSFIKSQILVWLSTALISYWYFDFISFFPFISNLILVPIFTVLVFYSSLPLIFFSEVFNIEMRFLFNIVEYVYNLILNLMYYFLPLVEEINDTSFTCFALASVIFLIYSLYIVLNKYLIDRGLGINR